MHRRLLFNTVNKGDNENIACLRVELTPTYDVDVRSARGGHRRVHSPQSVIEAPWFNCSIRVGGEENRYYKPSDIDIGDAAAAVVAERERFSGDREKECEAREKEPTGANAGWE